jgi:4'-phosphopantetheinyl transferase
MKNITEGTAPVIYVAKIADFTIGNLAPLLSDTERVRLDRFRQTVDKERHALAHSLKRAVISQYLSCAPSELSFSQSTFGKPFCQDSKAPHFNLSHSGGWVVLAVSTEGEIGVDIEFVREFDADGIIRRICSPREINIYQNSNSPKQCFLRLWTQKEAISKACGQGISVGLSSIPCSGEVGDHLLSFLGISYTAYTYSFPDDGVLSYATVAHTRPEIVRVVSLPCGVFGKPFESIDFAL